MHAFLEDVLKGLSAKEKYLESKYFYDAEGDRIFQQIMDCPEYYLTNCEMEIFTQQTKDIATLLINKFDEFDVVELGAGDATKSVHLLQELVAHQVSFTYFPVDISGHVIETLHEALPQKLPSLHVEGLHGEYFPMLKKAKTLSKKIKVVLFLGSNIGNIPQVQAVQFCTALRSYLTTGDIVLIGFDLKKDPAKILAAYNDASGHTKAFNLNLLRRINDELSGSFNPENFMHYPTYDPGTGACKSYLVSTVSQDVEVADHHFHFAKGEAMFTEISQKYTPEETDQIATHSGFKPIRHFYDSNHWFLDSIWQCV